MNLSINGQDRSVTSSEEVEEALEEMSSEQYLEAWLTSTPSDPSLSLLANGKHAWLMFLREAGDVGFSSRNPDYSGPAEGSIEYRLSNGQLDWYPASWAVARQDAINAAVYFASNRSRAPWIEWHEN